MLEVIVQTVNDTAHKPNPVGRKRITRRPYIPLHDIAPDADANDPVVIQKRRENEAARLAHETLEDAKERQRAKAREYAALRKARSQNTSTQDASASQAPLLSSEEVSESNPFAQLAHDAPGSVEPPESGIPPDIYKDKKMPQELRDALPALPKGRPSKAMQAARNAIIRSYWVIRGYAGS
jgi:hypothetical protein